MILFLVRWVRWGLQSRSPLRLVRRLPLFARWGVVFWAVMMAIASYCRQTYGPQGDAPPPAPPIAQWRALPPNAAFTYQVTELCLSDYQNDTLISVRPYAINNAAQIVGEVQHIPATAPAWCRTLLHLPVVSLVNGFKYRSAEQSAFWWDKGRSDLLPYLHDIPFAKARALNDAGQIVGDVLTDVPGWPQTPVIHHAVLWDNFRAAPRDLGITLTPFSTSAFGINTRKQVGIEANNYVTDRKRFGANFPVYSWENSAYLWENGISRLMARGLTSGSEVACRINNKGEAVANIRSATDDGEDAPALLSVGHPPVVLSVLKKNNTYRIPLNQTGDTTGYAGNNEENGRGPSLWHNNHGYEINDLLGSSPQWRINTVFCMNDRGQMVAQGRLVTPPVSSLPDGQYEPNVHILLLTPILPAANQ